MKNLALLADYLENEVPPEKFNIFSFRDSADHTLPVSDKQLFTECGTTACAVGWACAMPEMQAQGLSWDVKRRHPSINGMSIFNGQTLETLGEFFGVTKAQVEWLFYFYSYPKVPNGTSLPAVVRRMRHLLAGGSIEDYRELVELNLYNKVL